MTLPIPSRAKLFKELERLHAMGFALHWIRPGSKAPFEKRWQQGARKSLEELEADYRKGYNLGVRLGRASRFKDDTYLAVIDCDIKSDKEDHLKEMHRALKKIYNAIEVYAPEVLSGRANGSRHVYIRTEEPLRPFRYTASSEKVRCHMPSVPARKAELAELTPKEIAKGIRIRNAWEISFMGEGQQVVLPPSIHPDSGKAYEWEIELEKWTDIPLKDVESPHARTEREQKKSLKHFKAKEIDLFNCNLPDSTVDMIMGGQGVSDRSAALFTVCIHMVKAGWDDTDILSVLTDPENYLGEVAYEHTKSPDRKKAAEWIKNYTLAKVKGDLSTERLFKEAAVMEDLDDEDGEKQRKKILGERFAGDDEGESWRRLIERVRGDDVSPPKPLLKNVKLILDHEAGRTVFMRNLFSNITHYGCDAPWGPKKGKEFVEDDLVHIKHWLSIHYRFEPSTALVLEAVQKISNDNSYHPVRDYLKTLKWDGIERIDTWLKEYLGATGPDEYLRAVSRKTLTAMVARVLQPGVKFDTVLVLEGPQGCGKSSAVRILSEPWFSDAMINIGDKDAVLAIRSTWILELGELSSMRKADIDQLKQFISQTVDRIRVPYGRLPEAFPRQNIFIGTTNSSEYLKDSTGNRRFWPVKVRQCQFEELIADRDQLIAEAQASWGLGEAIYLDTPELEQIAMKEQAKRIFLDAWGERINNFIDAEPENFPCEGFTMLDLFGDFGPLDKEGDSRANQMRAADALRQIGYERIQMRGPQGKTWYWRKKGKSV